MRIITTPEPARKIRPATREEMEAATTFTLELTERDVTRVYGLFDEWSDRRNGEQWRLRKRSEELMACTFKWVEVKGAKTFLGLMAELWKHGMIPSAEWCAAIQRMSRSERPFVCAIAATAGTHVNGAAVFPCVHVDGTVNFLPPEGGDYTGWRWLVAVCGE